jgi:rubrerythrin
MGGCEAMSTEWHGGKGSGRRKEDASKINENWDRIFGSKVRSKTMDNYKCETEHTDDGEDGEWTCDMCGGPMYRQAHWNYAQCDDCGARQELIDDDYT